MNWKVRFKNPYFWITLIGVILTAMGISPEMFTSWAIVGDKFYELINNPYMLASVIIAIIGVINDPTTNKLKDSKRAKNYINPYAD